MADDGKHWVGGMVLCSHSIGSFALPRSTLNTEDNRQSVV